MYTQEQRELLKIFFNDKSRLSAQELKKLFVWLNSEKGNRELEQLLDDCWQSYAAGNENSINSAKILETIRIRIHRRKNTEIRRKIGQWLPYAAAILVIGLMVTSLQFYTIKPRVKNEAVLLYEYKSLAREPKKVVLPDGSKIVLFPGSSLVVPENFEKAPVRNAKLEGEAFFEIAPDTRQPFVLNMGGIGLKVVGTRFNVSNYPDDAHVNVALESGKVQLFQGSWSSHAGEIPLEPGFVASYTRGKDGYTIEETDVSRYTSWVNGVLMFRDDPMKEVFRKLERWYGVDIEVLDPSINEYIYTATIKNENLEQILKLVEYTSPVECRIVKDQYRKISKVYIQKRKS